MLRVVEVLDSATKIKKQVGFVYFYDDAFPGKDGTKADKAFVRRIKKIRKENNIGDEYPVWEFNFWFNPDVSDIVACKGVQEALDEFTRGQMNDRALVMFVDPDDIGIAVQEILQGEEYKGKSTVDLLQMIIDQKIKHEDIEERIQDIRILKLFGFQFKGEMKYEQNDKLPSWLYIRGMFQHLKSSIPPSSSPAVK